MPIKNPAISIYFPMATQSGRHIRSIEKSIVLSVRDFFVKEKEDGPILLDKPIQRVAEATGMHQRTIYRICREHRDKEHIESPRKRGRKEHSGPVREYTDNFQEAVIRRRIHKFYTNKVFPTLTLLHAALVEEEEFPYSRASLHRIISRMGFRHKTMNRKKCLYEQHRIVASRAQYLKEIKRFRSEGRPIIYLDETWLNQHHTVTKCWTDYDGKGGLKIPSSKGKRLIILHAGCEQGWIDGAELIFVGKRDSGDYHNEMNILHFMEWFREKLLPNCPPRSVIVLDNAKYHNAVVEKIPTKSSRKQDMLDWLAKHKIRHEKKMLKAELYFLIWATNPVSVYQTDVFAQEKGHCCLRLPVGHCELNPIELAWAQVKGYAARKNTGISGFTMENILQLAREGMLEVTPDRWAGCVEHVREKVEKHYWEVDGLRDDLVERMVIEVGHGDTSSSESEVTVSDTESD